MPWQRAAAGTLFSILWGLPLIRHLEATTPWELSFIIASKAQFSPSRGVPHQKDIKNCDERWEEKPGARAATPRPGSAAFLLLLKPFDFAIPSAISPCDSSTGSRFVDQHFLFSQTETEAKPGFRGELGYQLPPQKSK